MDNSKAVNRYVYCPYDNHVHSRRGRGCNLG